MPSYDCMQPLELRYNVLQEEIANADNDGKKSEASSAEYVESIEHKRNLTNECKIWYNHLETSENAYFYCEVLYFTT